MLRLPFPPSLNGLFNNTRRGRAKTKAYEKWINAAGMELMIQRPHKRAGAYLMRLSQEHHSMGFRYHQPWAYDFFSAKNLSAIAL